MNDPSAGVLTTGSNARMMFGKDPLYGPQTTAKVLTCGRGSKIGTQNVTLVNGNMDEHLHAVQFLVLEF